MVPFIAGISIISRRSDLVLSAVVFWGGRPRFDIAAAFFSAVGVAFTLGGTKLFMAPALIASEPLSFDLVLVTPFPHTQLPPWECCDYLSARKEHCGAHDRM